MKLQRQSKATGIVGGVFLLLVVGSVVGCPGKKAPDKPAGTNGGVGGDSATAAADPGKAIFDSKCLACHTVGKGDGVGPDLKGVVERREKAWLVKWLKDPMGMLETDEIAKELLKKYKNIPMPNQQLSDAEVENVLAYLGEGFVEETKKLELVTDSGDR